MTLDILLLCVISFPHLKIGIHVALRPYMSWIFCRSEKRVLIFVESLGLWIKRCNLPCLVILRYLSNRGAVIAQNRSSPNKAQTQWCLLETHSRLFRNPMIGVHLHFLETGKQFNSLLCLLSVPFSFLICASLYVTASFFQHTDSSVYLSVRCGLVVFRFFEFQILGKEMSWSIPLCCGLGTGSLRERCGEEGNNRQPLCMQLLFGLSKHVSQNYKIKGLARLLNYFADPKYLYIGYIYGIC